jgi:pantetheine-phosphate adenylyltransferase
VSEPTGASPWPGADVVGPGGVAVCPGSYDPITLGHLDVIGRAAQLFGTVVVAVATNASKATLLDAPTRVELARAAVAALPGVRVELVPGLLVDFCRDVGATALVKGLRGGADYDAELPMALMNRHLTGIETVFLPADRSVAHIASSLVKDVARHGGRVDDLVPPGVAGALLARLADLGHLGGTSSTGDPRAGHGGGSRRPDHARHTTDTEADRRAPG